MNCICIGSEVWNRSFCWNLYFECDQIFYNITQYILLCMCFCVGDDDALYAWSIQVNSFFMSVHWTASDWREFHGCWFAREPCVSISRLNFHYFIWDISFPLHKDVNFEYETSNIKSVSLIQMSDIQIEEKRLG